MPAYCRVAACDAFRRELPNIETTSGLFRAAFAIAQHELQEEDVAAAEATIAELSRTIRRRVHSTSFEAKLAHLHDVLFDIVGFSGNVDDYYNPGNSYLPVVLRTRRGLPITLVLIYKCVAEELGLRVRGINSPGHFLAAVDAGSEEPASHQQVLYVDPFYGGELLTESDIRRRIAATSGKLPPGNSRVWLAPATHREWLARMLNNLQAVFAQAGRERDLLAMQELQQVLSKQPY